MFAPLIVLTLPSNNPGQPRVIIEYYKVLFPSCYIPSFKVIELTVLEKKIFKGILPYRDMGSPWSCDLVHS